MQPEEVYRLYLAIKAHFKSDYDYFKYNGKVKAGDLIKRKDRFNFHKLARKYDDEQIVDFFVSNAVYMSEKYFYPDHLTTDEADTIYKRFKERKQDFLPHFEKDVKYLIDAYPSFLKIEKGTMPFILKAVISSKISYETFIALEELMEFFKDFDEKLGDDDLFWPQVKQKCKNFQPFVWFAHDELRNVVRNCIN